MRNLKAITAGFLMVAMLLLTPAPMSATVSMARSDTSTSWVSIGATTWYPIGQCTAIRVHVFSAAGSSATVTIQVSPNSSGAPAYTVATITDPTGPDAQGNAGESWSIPTNAFARVNVTVWNSGTISANLEGYRDGQRIF